MMCYSRELILKEIMAIYCFEPVKSYHIFQEASMEVLPWAIIIMAAYTTLQCM